MSRSIPDTLGDRPQVPPGERRRTCDYCGIEWYQSQMFKDPAGYWRCPDDAEGRDQVTLNRLNQQAALTARARMARKPTDW